jgi:NAD(P)-dependent dehydrogenase (short-subunit alcohol dehydrogenase family)
MMDFGLKGRVAIVTGGSEGIGKAIALRLASEGVKVAICARRKDVLQKAAAEISQKTGGEVLAISADVTKPDQVESFVNQTLQRFGKIDILVNNAGRACGGYFEDISEETWREDFELKFFAAVRFCKLAIPHMKKQNWGRIINITHPGGKQPGANSVPTSVSRAAGIAFTKALSKDYAPNNILVNTVCLSNIKSAQGERSWKSEAPNMSFEEYYKERGKNLPLKRMGEAEEVADLVAFLVSERAGFITGTAINIDGGVSAVI